MFEKIEIWKRSIKWNNPKLKGIFVLATRKKDNKKFHFVAKYLKFETKKEELKITPFKNNMPIILNIKDSKIFDNRKQNDKSTW